MKSPLQRLADWYAAQCDDDWEHGMGITISSIDNPGFAVDIDLRGTSLELVAYEEKKDRYESKEAWMICYRTKEKFEGRGAPSRLEDIICEFLTWAEQK
jgi:hypothetical protein